MPKITAPQAGYRKAFARTAAALLLATGAPLAAAQVVATDAWVRGTVAPQKSTGVFMKLKSPVDAVLVGVASPAAKLAEIHEMVMLNNVMRMRPVTEVALPARKVVELKPGGNHVMLMGIERQFKKGDVIPITLTVRGRDGKVQMLEVRAEVRDLAAPAAPKQPMEPGRR